MKKQQLLEVVVKQQLDTFKKMTTIDKNNMVHYLLASYYNNYSGLELQKMIDKINEHKRKIINDSKL